MHILERKGALLVIKLTKLQKSALQSFDSTSLKAAIGILSTSLLLFVFVCFFSLVLVICLWSILLLFSFCI